MRACGRARVCMSAVRQGCQLNGVVVVTVRRLSDAVNFAGGDQIAVQAVVWLAHQLVNPGCGDFTRSNNLPYSDAFDKFSCC